MIRRLKCTVDRISKEGRGVRGSLGGPWDPAAVLSHTCPMSERALPAKCPVICPMSEGITSKVSCDNHFLQQILQLYDLVAMLGSFHLTVHVFNGRVVKSVS